MSPFEDGSMPEDGRVSVRIPGIGWREVSFLAYRVWRNAYAAVSSRSPWRAQQVTIYGPMKRGPKPKAGK